MPPGSTQHIPVLAQETVEMLAPAPGRVIVDGTLGGGGHSAALLAKGANVVAFDQDPEAVAYASRRLLEWDQHFRPVRGSFSKAGELLDSIGINRIDGALLDLGVS